MPRASICLCMIVKNEAPVIERCLNAVLPHIDSWAIVDTGSTDETRGLIADFFARVGIPGELLERPWRDFATNRTEALQAARGRADYTLIIDADDVLEVADTTDLRAVTGDAYSATLIDGTTRYIRTQLVRSKLDWIYRGVLHEFLECPNAAPSEVLPGFFMYPNHDGARRRDPTTYARDAALLERALATESDEMLRRRYTYYLAQSYRDAHEPQKAAEAYGRRAEMGGWEEERWHARLQGARSLLEVGDESGFLKTIATAYTERPQRAEPLVDLARFFRMRGRHEEAVQAAKLAAQITYPASGLFIEDYAYRVGVRQELSISGYYCGDEADRSLGRQMANELALERSVPSDARWYARNHLTYYADPIADLCPSWRATRLNVECPPGYTATNPAIYWDRDAIRCITKVVNFDISDGVNFVVPGGGPIVARNFLCRLSAAFEIETSVELVLPGDFKDPRYRDVLGVEDLRLFPWRGRLWCLGSTRQLNATGLNEMVLAEIIEEPGTARIGKWKVISDLETGRHEKNWTPVYAGGELRFLYAYDPAVLLREDGSADQTETPTLALDHLRGGTPPVLFDDGWLTLTHEVQMIDERRLYLHRFVHLDSRLCPVTVSEPFYFLAKGLEFAAGLCWAEIARTLVISFGAKDAEAWVGKVDVEDVRRALRWHATDTGQVRRRD